MSKLFSMILALGSIEPPISFLKVFPDRRNFAPNINLQSPSLRTELTKTRPYSQDFLFHMDCENTAHDPRNTPALLVHSS